MNDNPVSKNGSLPGNPSANGHKPVLRADTLNIGYGQHIVVEGLSLDLLKGGVTALVGPNGSGKSTLLKTLARLLQPSSGAVYLNGKAISRMPTSAVAQEIAVLPQGPVAPAGLTVAELVEQGRYPHAGPLRMLRKQDYSAIGEAMRLTGMEDFAHRSLDSLSGGEKQRAWIALALAQETPVLLLDEPTTFLDIGHQLEVLELVEQLNRNKGMTVVLVLHDLNHAARYAGRMVALKEGRIVADGSPSEVLTSTLLTDLFGVHAHIIPDPETGKPVCLPYAVVTQEQEQPINKP